MKTVFQSINNSMLNTPTFSILILTKKQTSLKSLLKRSKFLYFENYFLKMGVVQQLPMLAVVFYSNFSSRNQGVCLLSFFEILLKKEII